ncbi:MAG: 23S rRNA (uracil1939-C5)-methyltransferase [Lentisphaeria bacterium]|jgi:23S rRNA (uracil1939-C5)-methyltransferase
MEKINSIFEATVKDLVSDGRGVITHPRGRTMFAAGVWPGEHAKFRIKALKGSTGSAELVELLSSSPDRITAPCPHHGFEEAKCGGCPWQFMSYDAQLKAKQMRVEKAFSRLGVENVREIWHSPKVMGYRNRAQFKSNGRELGFVSSQSNTLAPIEDCLVLSDKNRQTLSELLTLLPNPLWRGNRKKPLISIDINEDVGAENINIDKRLPFAQANSEQNLRMQSWLLNKLSVINKSNTVIELFCGSGNFTQVIASQKFAKIVAVESVDEALDAVKQKSLLNVKTLRQNLFLEGAFEKLRSKYAEASVLVLDPPREGIKNKEGLFYKKSKLKKVFYISCDLATLVRDVQEFKLHKFSVVEVQPLDQFPHTPHIELLVELTRA